MTREDIKKLFPDATDEQITNLLNQSNAELVRERKQTEKYRTDAQKAADLQKQLDDLNAQNMTEIEKANKATETANNRVADLEKQVKSMQTRASLAELGIIGEQAEKLINTDGVLDFTILGQIISDREKKAAAQKESDLLDNTRTPGGGTGGDPKDEKPADVKNVESIKFSGLDKNAQSARDYYK